MREIKILEPHGYCSGVTNAINIAKKAKLEHSNQEVYLLGMLVHNEHVIKQLTDLGIICFTCETKTKEELITMIPDGSVIIFSAHGHSDKLNDLAKQKHLIVYDATCPKVEKNMNLIKEEIAKGGEVIYVGQKGHAECEAALSISEKVSLYDTKLLINNYKYTNRKPLVVNQTTLNIIELSNIYKDILKDNPGAVILDEICASTRLRQEALRNIPKECDLILVIGDTHSSNTNRLKDVAEHLHPNIPTVMVSSLDELDKDLIKEKKNIVISTGASTSPEVINDIYNYLNN